MTVEKFEEQITTVARFIQIYCDDKHDSDRLSGTLTTEYHGAKFEINYHLCPECEHLLRYADARLRACPHEDKPMCHNCKKICYEKQELRQIVSIMRYSGIKLGLSKIKEKVCSFKSKIGM